MNVFITGTSGYIGGSVARLLLEHGHQVRGLVRSAEKAALLSRLGIVPVLGDLDDLGLLAREARAADAVINAASSDHAGSVHAIIDALADSGKALLHTSGTSVIGDDARGERESETILDEKSDLHVQPGKQHRRDIDLAVLHAAARGVRSAVICPSLIYGLGSGLSPDSVQIPFLIRNAREQGAVQIVGHGVNRWSNVHIDDLKGLYLRALTNATAGAFYFAESGEASFAEIGSVLSERLGLPLEWLPAEVAAARWGEARAYFTFGSNCRVRGVHARSELGWAPVHRSVIDWIRTEPTL